MSFLDIYDQYLQSLAHAVQYDKLRELIQGIVHEVTEMGLSPQLLRELAISGRVNGDNHEPTDHIPETSQGKINPVSEVTQQYGTLRRPKVVYELKSESGQLVSQLRVWIRPSLLQSKPQKDPVAGLNADVPNTLESPVALPEEAKKSKAGSMIVAPSVLCAAVKGISFPLGLEKTGNTVNFGIPKPDDRLSEHQFARTGEMNEVEFVVPLAQDAEFFTTLACNLEDISSQLKTLYSVFSETIADLATTIEDTCHPASVAANFHPYSSVSTHLGTVEVKANYMKSDLYAWRDIFQLYVEAKVFEYNGGGEWSLDESEKRLKSFVDKAAQRWLPGSRNLKQRRLVKGKGLRGNKKFKHKQSIGALETFVKLNLLALDIKKFSYVNAEAIVDLLRTRAEHSALPTPFSLKDRRAVSSSPLTVLAVHSPLPHSSFHIVESLAPSLLKPFVHSIVKTLLPIVPSVEDYSCAVCMNIAFKPIRLSCTHVFCVRCLVKMQKRGEGKCPMCRAPSVLGANSRNVDWALLNFMGDWFPIEAREKLKANEKEVTAELLAEWGANQAFLCFVTPTIT